MPCLRSSGKAISCALDGTDSIPAVERVYPFGSIQPPLKWVPELSRVKEAEHRDSHPTSSSAVVVNMWTLAAKSPMGFHCL